MSSDFASFTADGAVKLRIGATGPCSRPPETLPAALATTVASFPDSLAIGADRDGSWSHITFRVCSAAVNSQYITH